METFKLENDIEMRLYKIPNKFLITSKYDNDNKEKVDGVDLGRSERVFSAENFDNFTFKTIWFNGKRLPTDILPKGKEVKFDFFQKGENIIVDGKLFEFKIPIDGLIYMGAKMDYLFETPSGVDIENSKSRFLSFSLRKDGKIVSFWYRNFALSDKSKKLKMYGTDVNPIGKKIEII